MKHIKRLFIFLALAAAAAVVINANTRFFKDIDKNIPFIGENYPYLAEQISELSDRVNEAVSHIPSPSEMISRIRGVELPIDPEDTASNIYYSSDTMLTFYSGENVSVDITENGELDVYGIADPGSAKYLVYRFLDENGEVLDQYVDPADDAGKFRRIMRIPDDTHQFAVFTGPERYGEFSGMVYDYIYLERTADGLWQVAVSPVYEHNTAEYEKLKSISTALRSTYSVCSGEASVAELSRSITQGVSSEYDKALAIHDWVCENIFYDSDSINGSTNTAPYVASDVIETKRAVCLGYANLYAALCRAADIPCNVVTGYALGVSGSSSSSWDSTNIGSTEANHAWNEVYIDSRWIIVDTTWDSRSSIKNGEALREGSVSHLYFDANLRFFSANHKILEYVK